MKFLELNRKEIPALVDDLNRLLANYQVYYQKLKNFHWNVRGKFFFELHERFEELYEQAREDIDLVAERVQILKYRPMSTLAKYLKTADIREDDSFSSDQEMVETIIMDHHSLIRNMRSILEKAGDVKDEGTVDMISGMLRYLEKQSWMLENWVSKPMEPMNESTSKVKVSSQ